MDPARSRALSGPVRTGKTQRAATRRPAPSRGSSQALGAARLGWLAAGGDEALVCTRPDITSRHSPDTARHEQLKPRLERFRQVYQRLKTLAPA